MALDLIIVRCVRVESHTPSEPKFMLPTNSLKSKNLQLLAWGCITVDVGVWQP